MKKRKLYQLGSILMMVIILSLCRIGISFAQNTRSVKGTIIDSLANSSLPGVNVMIKGTSRGVATDVNGDFTLEAASNEVLVFSFIGYNKKEVTVGNQSVFNISLSPSNTNLDELVVVGYGTMKKSSVTAAVSKIENVILDQIPAGRPESALVGRLAGVNISQTRSTPGSAPLIRIRGAGSIDAGNEPLVVIDGFPGGSLGSINMNDVQSIEVLKDASSAAIYGSRAAGGVIIVTTKKGKSGKPKFSVNAYTGLAKARGHDDWLSGQEYYDYAVRYQNREYAWVGGDVSIPIWGDSRRPNQYQVSDVLKNGNNVNWQDQVLQTVAIQNYNVSVSGGTDNAKYYISTTLKDEKGTLKNTWYKNYGVRANVDLKVNSVVSVGLMVNPSYSNRRYAPIDINGLVKYPSFVAVQNPDGTYPKSRDYWGFVVSGQVNPMAVLNGSDYKANTFNNIGEAYINFDIAPGLRFKSSIGSNIAYNTTQQFQATYAASTGTNSGSEATSRGISLLNENVLSYSTTLKENHEINAIAGASYQQFKSNSSSMTAVAGSFNNDIIHTLNNAIINPALTSTSKSQWGLISYFTRVHYGYKNKYLLSASIRTDGSSRFGPDNRWGYFPSASVAWRVSQEPFLQNVKAISDLKIRASYGATGNFNIGDFDYLGKIGDVYYAPGGVLTKGQAQTSFGNNKLSWEKTNGYDAGIDIGLFNNRLNLVIDYYDKKTSKLLYNVSIPSITGFATSISNIGQISNKGIELEINGRILTREFKWDASFNAAKNVNKVLDLGGVEERITTDTYGMSWLLRKGEKMFSYYGYKTIGVIKTQEELANSPVLAGSKLGSPKYQDTNGDGKINASDKVILGNFQPKAFLGFINNFSYKNFDLSIAMQASLGAKMYNFENEYYQGALLGAMRRSLVETQWWSASEPGDNKMPASALSTLSFQSSSDVYIENASFLAVRNINLGYTLPASIAQKLKMSNFRIYTSLANPIMITSKDFHGYNPEGYTAGEIAGISSKPGLNNGSEPINRVITLGVNVSF